VIRNAGGVVTDDEIRSLAISQRLLGTEEIMLIHHTDCEMLTFADDDFRKGIQRETGIKPEWPAEAFDDLDEDVRQSIARIKASPFIPQTDSVRGFVLRRRDREPARGQLGDRLAQECGVGDPGCRVGIDGSVEQRPRLRSVDDREGAVRAQLDRGDALAGSTQCLQSPRGLAR
jgi:hypothetical protein